jgi:vacuolar-type H+-ATPase subunit F/Vma7
MSRIAAIGESAAIDGFGLAGVELLPAEDAAAARRAWTALAPGVGLLLLTPAAEAALDRELAEAPELLRVVIPA